MLIFDFRKKRHSVRKINLGKIAYFRSFPEGWFLADSCQELYNKQGAGLIHDGVGRGKFCEK